jgi:hypothetical protein
MTKRPITVIDAELINACTSFSTSQLKTKTLLNVVGAGLQVRFKEEKCRNTFHPKKLQRADNFLA